jgi:cell division protein FtsB
VLDQLETILRHVADELAVWRARAVKAEGELKEAGGRSGSVKADAETRGRVSDLEQENKALRQRVEAARVRVHDLLSRLTFLEEQAREAGGNGRTGGGGRGAGGGATAPDGVAGLGGASP